MYQVGAGNRLVCGDSQSTYGHAGWSSCPPAWNLLESWHILSDGVRPAANELNFGKKRVMITWVRPDSYGPLGFQPFS